MAFFEERDGYIILNLRIIPRAAQEGISGVLGDALKIRIQAPPVEGKANACLIKFLCKRWKVPASKIEILSGTTGRSKRVKIMDPPPALLEELKSLSSPPGSKR